MKKILIFFILILFSCKSGDTNSEEKAPTVAPKPTAVAIENAKKVSERYELVAPDSVDVVKKTSSYTLGKRLLTVCNNYKFKKFTTKEATESVIKNTNLAKMTLICQKINQRNGKFIDLKLIDVIRDTQSEDQVFRYNINYQKKFFKRELKITINSEGKISAVSTREVTKVIK